MGINTKAPNSFNAAASNFCSRLSSCLGIGHLVNFTTALQRKEYAESLNELMKTALKWTLIGTVCMGVHKWTFRRPVFINDVHQHALQELNGGNLPVQGVSSDARALIDHYFTEQSSFKRWPQSGKDYVTQCLESSSQASIHSTSYLIEKGINNSDHGLINKIIKTCASASSDTQSCLTAEKVITQSAKAEDFSRKMLSSCKKSRNIFCQNVRSIAVAKAVNTQDEEQIIKNCIRQSNADAKCPAALLLLDQKLQDDSEDSWKLAKRIDSSCRSDHSDLCKKAHAKAIAETMLYTSSWQDIIRTIKSKCRTDTEGCSQLIEEATLKFLEEIKQDSSVREESWEVYWELKHNQYQNNPSKISIALTLANACAAIPFPHSKRDANQIVAFLEKYVNRISSSSYYWSSDSELERILSPKIADIKKKIAALTDIRPNTVKETSMNTDPVQEGEWITKHTIDNTPQERIRHKQKPQENRNKHRPQEKKNECKSLTTAGHLLGLFGGRKVLALASNVFDHRPIDETNLEDCTFF